MSESCCNRCGNELNYPQESHSDLCVECAKLDRIESGGESSSTSKSIEHGQDSLSREDRKNLSKSVKDGGEPSNLPSYLQLNEEIRDKEINITLAELHTIIYQFDWIEIMREAVESRPSSWGVQRGEEYAAVPEWRNASDTLTSPVWKRLFQELYNDGEQDD